MSLLLIDASSIKMSEKSRRFLIGPIGPIPSLSHVQRNEWQLCINYNYSQHEKRSLLSNDLLIREICIIRGSYKFFFFRSPA